MEHSKHVARMLLLVVLVLIGFHILRTLFTPKSFGRYGHYRADNVQEQMTLPVVYGERSSCLPCHGDLAGVAGKGSHASVECETCHAPVVTHIQDGKKYGEMSRSRFATLCLRCHERLDARPSDFPQIKLEEHVPREQGGSPKDVCFDCHDPHSPKMGG